MKITPEESQKILSLFAQGYSRIQIAEMVGRPKPTINVHILVHSMAPEKRAARIANYNQKKRERKQAEKTLYARFVVKKDGFGTLCEHPSARPPADVIAERDRRLSRPISIAHDLLGDPEFSRSALGMRLAAEVVGVG